MLVLLAAALLAAGGSPPTAASPASPTVMIARPADADPVLQETTSRLGRELAAAGYASEVATCPVDPVAGAGACARDQSRAAISLARADGETSIFVTSRLRSGRVLRRHVRVQSQDGGDDATLLAVRAVEVLRDLQLEVAQVAGDDEDPKPVELYKESAAPQPLRWYLWAGGSMLFVPWTTSRPVGATSGGALGLGAQVNEQVMVVLDAAGPFAGSLPVGSPRPSGGPYSDRSVYDVVARLTLRLGTGSAVRGMFSKLFVGLSYTYAELDSSISGSSRGALAPMVGGGPGYTFQLTPRLLASIDLEVAGIPNLRIETKLGGVLAESGTFRAFLNATAAVRLP